MRNFIQWTILVGLCGSSALAADLDARDAYRARVRNWVMSNAVSLPTLAPRENDLAADLVDRLSVSNLAEMEKQGLLKARLPESPWTDSYWPIYAGQIAWRYNDPEYRAALNWRENYNYLLGNLGRGDTSHLSPAEKYDLLIGDLNFTLTKKMISAGAPYADAEGKVETWFGLCHGWAPASFMMDRPRRSVSVRAADGRELTFTPSDLKALATLLWANGSMQTKFIGGRCNDKRPARDREMREKEPDCQDTNPATWHQAIVNQIGVSQRSFVMDASAGYEVWNHPVIGYEYSYIHPITKNSVSKLSEGKVRVADYAGDRYREFRAPGTASVVNVMMAVRYSTETQPTAEPTDSPENDAHQVVIYSYDLELDDKDEIIGGEWHGSLHPDFLWVPVAGTRAGSRGDAWLESVGDAGNWNGRSALPENWKKAARMSAERSQPLARLVEDLLARAQGE